MITKNVKLPTWFQRNVSPLATSVSAVLFQNREAVAGAVRAIANKLSPEERFVLRMSLNKSGLLLPRFRAINIADAEHYHLSKNITATRLTLAAHDFFRNTGRDDFIMILPEIIRGKASERLDLSSGQIDYRAILSAAKPSILRELHRKESEETNWESEAIDHAFELASRVSHAEKSTLLYRIQKMADIGGDIQSIVASLFMDMPIKKVNAFLSHSQSEDLINLCDSACKIIERYQGLKNNFNFDPSRIAGDEKYLCCKMGELIREAQLPKSLLLFFLNKLAEARATEGRSSPIFSEIRFLLAPMAERLGLVFLADDFRDQFLRLGNPLKHAFIADRVRKRTGMDYEKAKIFLNIFTRELFGLLLEKMGPDSQGINIKFRVKSAYSIWNKVEIRREYSYDELNDILGVKVICESEQQLVRIRDILKKNSLFTVKPETIKEVLGKSAEGKWRGVKMVGEDAMGIPLEIQIMTREMNNENNRGLAATWRYNLAKELGTIRQMFDRLEPKVVIGPNFVENFYQLLDYC